MKRSYVHRLLFVRLRLFFPLLRRAYTCPFARISFQDDADRSAYMVSVDLFMWISIHKVRALHAHCDCVDADLNLSSPAMITG